MTLLVANPIMGFPLNINKNIFHHLFHEDFILNYCDEIIRSHFRRIICVIHNVYYIIFLCYMLCYALCICMTKKFLKSFQFLFVWILYSQGVFCRSVKKVWKSSGIIDFRWRASKITKKWEKRLSSALWTLPIKSPTQKIALYFQPLKMSSLKHYLKL